MHTAVPAADATRPLSDQSANRFAPGAGDAAMVQLLTPAGELSADPPFEWRPDVDVARGWLRDLTLARRLDDEGRLLQRQGKLSLWVELQGQEAVQVGLAAALGEHDYVFPSYREHGIAHLLGLPTSKLLALWGSSEFCDWDTLGGRLGPYQLVIGAQPLHAVGYAMGQAFDGDPGVTVAFHGDGATSQGDVNEAYAFAASYQAPVVFVCTNNQWAISEPVSRQSRVPLYQRAWGFGIEAVQVDGNDVPAMYEVSKWALERTRSGAGPTLIEAFTYRMGAHTTSDDPTRYRGSDEVETWRQRDPIVRLRSWLDGQDAWSDADADELKAASDELGRTMRAECAALTPTPLAEMFDALYAEPDADLVVQQRECAEWLAGFEDAR